MEYEEFTRKQKKDGKHQFIVHGELSHSIVRKDIALGSGVDGHFIRSGERHVGVPRLPNLDVRFTYWAIELIIKDLRGTVEVQAGAGQHGTGMVDLMCPDGRGDLSKELLCQAVANELDQGDNGAEAKTLDLLGGTTTLTGWSLDKKKYTSLEKEREFDEMVNCKLNERELRTKLRQRRGSISIKVRIFFRLNSDMGNGIQRIVTNDDPCVAVVSIIAANGSSCKLKSDSMTFYWEE